MKTSKNLYPRLCSYRNLERAFEKASKGKGFMPYVVDFEENLEQNLLSLKKELESFTYAPHPLKTFVIHDPKTRVIRKSHFRDRIVHHAIVNILEPVYEKIFIYDSYANRKGKGTLKAVQRFDKFKHKISRSKMLVRLALNDNMVKGYVLKADIKKFFDSMNHQILLNQLQKKIKDKKFIWLVNTILKNFHNQEKGIPLGNMTSQFFANVYLNELDYYVKHKLKAKHYIRYVDDFVILHKSKERLREYQKQISLFLKEILFLELHPDKSKIFSMYKGVDFLGYRIFYYHKLLRKRNLLRFRKRLTDFKWKYEDGLVEYERITAGIEGWFAYAIWADTYKLRKALLKEIKIMFNKNHQSIAPA